MKFLFRLILIVLGIYFTSMVGPWWMIFVVSFTVGFLIHGFPVNVFIAGFLGAGGTWITLSWYLDYKSEGFFSDKIVQLFPVEDSIYLIVGAGLIAGLCGGVGGLTGDSFKKLFVRKKQKSAYN